MPCIHLRPTLMRLQMWSRTLDLCAFSLVAESHSFLCDWAALPCTHLTAIHFVVG